MSCHRKTLLAWETTLCLVTLPFHVLPHSNYSPSVLLDHLLHHHHHHHIIIIIIRLFSLLEWTVSLHEAVARFRTSSWLDPASTDPLARPSLVTARPSQATARPSPTSRPAAGWPAAQTAWAAPWSSTGMDQSGVDHWSAPEGPAPPKTFASLSGRVSR